ncbi:MAG: glycosyltransferase [Fibromonadaceae bacterium]|jgi:glycosyltransferase involved in cell wall biosynthesis|nr:glycosyltransferase [Fibromonadaceae bacterium]
MINPLVSIIIPVYNGSNYLREAIDSALAQTYQSCEIIVVNDGSNDNTEEICLSYGNRIRYFIKENGGVSTALNFGIENMRGEYFSWLSHDDIYYPDKIEKQINALKEDGDMKKIAWGDFDMFNESSKSLKRMCFGEMNNENMLTDSIFPLLKHYIGGCALLIHRLHFNRVGLFKPELRYTQDYELWFRMLREQKTVYVCSPLYKMRLHNGQGTVTEANKMLPVEAELWFSFTQTVTHNEAERMFGSLSEFYRQMYIKMTTFGDDSAAQSILDMFLKQPVASGILLQTEIIKNFFSEITHKKSYRLCIFCAGNNGLKLYHEFLTLRIKIDFFADNSINKQGNIIVNNIKCLSFDGLLKIKDNTIVIVANRQPDAIMEQLKEACFPVVISDLDVYKQFERVH